MFIMQYCPPSGDEKKQNITIYSVESGAALHTLQSDRSGHKWAFCKKQQQILWTIHIKTSN